ncbi:MAG: ATP-binding protein [Candidatus Cloacimonetes bacterium]|jgi:signal transduction histidine kinase|nr:PAS domain-containing sensor histidine kinase [Candidatus Cloacimonadota bacterium]MDY0336496.1 ATP-binding protein [Candidatus Cloacimonadaceae bacterium]MCB5269954.1 PAS domain-containing sensor histidine kinase [Candidatus Cloacimonadota bacterium]MCK9333880.1 ATP-binding protein [Candidatus Cloacimonadota bacterium]MDD2543034.1 ATP-binding protein [Candidatus Cloacimonadota bacterium]
MNYDSHAMSAAETIFALRERVKELTCLYRITDLANRTDLAFEDFMKQVLNIIPRSMQYPSATGCRIQIDGKNYDSPNLEFGNEHIVVDISANQQLRGTIQVYYQDSANVEFLHEETLLLKGVAQQLALVLERKGIEDSNQKLQEQLRHADRLATIGQLSAGIAHEINEPLSAILGFGQLLKSDYQLPEAAEKDVQKIIASALHAREVVRKLMLFSRQVPPKMKDVNLNKLIEEGFYFLENRCQKQSITIVKELQEALPDIVADASQMHQVLVNLSVNAMQAMPEGGTLTIRTSCSGDTIEMQVADTGIGMDRDLVQKIFIPFFTTKDVDQGTGLGLPVVHGIISSHHGAIKVESEPGQGTTFRIFLKVNND